MDYIEKTVDEIKNDWFKDHVVGIETFRNGQVIYFKEPGTFMYAVKIVLHGSNIFISGDIGEAVYNLTCEATLENIETFDLHYLHGKLVTSSHGKWDFSEEKAQIDLDNYYKDNELEKDKIYEAIKYGIDEYGHNLESYRASLLVVYETTSADSDLMSDANDFGKEMSRSHIAYWIALKTAAKYVRENLES